MDQPSNEGNPGATSVTWHHIIVTLLVIAGLLLPLFLVSLSSSFTVLLAYYLAVFVTMFSIERTLLKNQRYRSSFLMKPVGKQRLG